MWYSPLERIESLGSTSSRPGSLAGLAQARSQHKGQFFTPSRVARFMWSIAEQAMSHADSSRRFSILDTSVGSGRLLQFANPERHKLYGVDVDQKPLAALGKAAEEAGFLCEFEHCGMEEIDPTGFDFAMINPPFSVHLDAPTVQPLACTNYGRFGPNSAALSHSYALAQAMDAAQIVVALLPRSFTGALLDDPAQYIGECHSERFVAVFDLPAGSFRDEGTEVAVSVVVMGQGGKSAKRTERIALDQLPGQAPQLASLRLGAPRDKPRLKRVGVEEGSASITVPVTGNPDVRISHDGRWIKLQYACGLTMAKVANAILRAPVTKVLGDEQRLPRGVKYDGQGVLDLEVHLAQDNPKESFEGFVSQVSAAGGNPVVDPGLRAYLHRAVRRSERQGTPLRHVVFVKDGVAGDSDVLLATPKRPQVADPKSWGSPALEVGTQYEFHRDADVYRFEVKGKEFRLTPEDLFERFEVTKGMAESGWQVVHEGLHKAYPQLSEAWMARARATGVSSMLTWGYQLADAVELAMKPVGAVGAWDMGLGKARLAVALILLHQCKHGLIVTEAGLVDEMVMELEGLPIPREAWQVITSPDQARSLRKINVISYERLRMPCVSANRQTVNRARHSYAGLMRRRIGVGVLDEGDLLSNPRSDQSRACAQLALRKRFVLSGTPIGNYPRDIGPILAFTSGDGTAAQPWGWRRGKLDPNWLQSMSISERGIDAFRNTFVCLDWVTREWEDTMTEGAKREIPRIANLEKYRAMLAPHIKRRIIEEPEVAEWISIPKESRSIVTVPWDSAHLAYYLEVVEEFTNLYRRRMGDGKGNNLIEILAKIRAVSFASDYPQHAVEGFSPYGALTSKQRWVIEEVKRLTGEGKKTLVYAENPGNVDLLARHLGQCDTDLVRFHGGIPIKKRTREMNQRFRFGPTPNMLATLGVVQKGLNLWQAEEVILLSRSWSATTEEQAIRRTLRPQQKKNVRVRYVHLPGSIDAYKAQLVEFKRDSAAAGLDWGTPETEDVEFLHLSTVIARFVEDMAKLHQVARHDLRKLMKAISKGEVCNA